MYRAAVQSLVWVWAVQPAIGRAIAWMALAIMAPEVLLAQEVRFTQDYAETLPITVPHSSGEDILADTMTLADFESLALVNNPTLVQAGAQIQAARGGAFQAGLYLNPEVGYTSDQIGIEGTAGELHGGYLSQEFVTGGKLRLSRAKWAQRARVAAMHFSAQRERVLNDVRVLFFRTIAAQRLVAIQESLLENAKDDVQTHREMLNLGQTNQAGLLQAEVDLQKSHLELQAAANQLEEDWRLLAAMVGLPQMQRLTLSGSLELADVPLDWGSALCLLLENSPELAAAREKVRHDEITVQRERVEPIPNVTVSASAGKNFETNDTVAAVTVGIPLPIFDMNRGTVQQALSDLRQSRANVKRLELELTTRLAGEFRKYQTAWQRVQSFQNDMLPKSKRAFDLLHQSYKDRRAAWPDVLMAQRLYLELQTQYVQNLMGCREADIAIRGMLLSGGLNVPPGPMDGGHIDAVPKPR